MMIKENLKGDHIIGKNNQHFHQYSFYTQADPQKARAVLKALTAEIFTQHLGGLR